MNRQEFAEQMDRMRNVYSEKAYPAERMEIIWDEMRWLTQWQFAAIVSEMIASNGIAPMIGKFRDAKFELSRKNAAKYEEKEQWWLDSMPDCLDCDKTGAILATHIDTKSRHAFRCHCKIGETKHHNYPKWGSEHFKTHIPEN